MLQNKFFINDRVWLVILNYCSRVNFALIYCIDNVNNSCIYCRIQNNNWAVIYGNHTIIIDICNSTHNCKILFNKGCGNGNFAFILYVKQTSLNCIIMDECGVSYNPDWRFIISKNNWTSSKWIVIGKKRISNLQIRISCDLH